MTRGSIGLAVLAAKNQSLLQISQLQRLQAAEVRLQGYKAQATMVVGALDQLVGRCEARRESLVCEGVHLSIKHVIALMQRHPTIVPFLVYISNEAKHRERFAVSVSELHRTLSISKSLVQASCPCAESARQWRTAKNGC